MRKRGDQCISSLTLFEVALFEPQRGSTSQPGVAQRTPGSELPEKTNPEEGLTNSIVEPSSGYMDER